VAHSLSAKKRVRQNLKRKARNRARKEQIKEEVKSFTSVLAKGDLTAAEQQLRKAVARIDKVASKNTIHKNAAARKRSRLTKKLNRARALAASGGGGGTATGGKKGAGTTA
jgi:small subunit ribosomal protein S20